MAIFLTILLLLVVIYCFCFKIVRKIKEPDFLFKAYSKRIDEVILLNNPSTIELYKELINANLLSGKLTKEQAKILMNKLRKK